MCFPTPKLPSLASASTPHSPTLVPTPTPGSGATPFSLASGTSPIPLATGHSKALRWCDDRSPASSIVVTPKYTRRRASYKETLRLPKPSPIQGQVEDNGLRPPKPPPLPKIVSSNLRGKCFNCFSSTQHATECHRLVRCFCCRLPEHHAYECPHRRSGAPNQDAPWCGVQSPRLPGWRALRTRYRTR